MTWSKISRDKTGPARLLDMVEGRSKQVFKQWFADRPQTGRETIEVVAMDGFSGFKTAAAEELLDAVPVMDPFHVVRLAGDALGFRNLTNDIARSLLEAGGFGPPPTPSIAMSRDSS